MGSSGEAEAGSRREAATGGEQQRRLLQHWGLRSAPAGRVRPQVSRAPRGAVVGEALVLTARELRLVPTLLLVMFMTGEAWRYIGALTGPRLLVLITGPILAAFALIGVGLGRQLRPAETVRVPGATGGTPAHTVEAPRVAHRRLVARVRVRVWLETLLVSIAVAGLFGFLGLATVDAELTREWSGQAAVPLLHSSTILGEELVVTAALLQVAGFLGALAALMFALEVLVDEQSRHEAAHGTLDRDAEPAGDVRVAGFASLLTGPTLQAIRELSARHPRLTISLQEREPREVDTMLADDAIDVGFVYDYSLVPRYHPDQEAVRLLAEKPMALLVPAHRRAGPFEQPARTLGSAQATWITNSRGTDDDELLHRVTAAHGAIARVAHRIDSLGLITELVAAGLGVGLMVADGPTHPGVSYVDLDGAAGSRRIYACTRPGRPHWRNNAAVITAVAAALARQPAPS